MMTADEAAESVGVAVLASEWLTVTFLHWPVAATALQRLLPAGLTVDEYDGQAWLSLIPFRMSSVGPPGPAALRRLAFAETNLRTYVRAPNGRAGIYFLRIEAASALMTIAARSVTGVGYRLGDLSVVQNDGIVSYGGALRDGSCAYRLDIRRGRRLLDPSPLDLWLTTRWRAYSRHLGMLLETPVEHEPWPLSAATVVELHETMSESFGLPGPGAEPLVHFSDGVRRVRVGVSRRLSLR
jgi:uncharacterized protein